LTFDAILHTSPVAPVRSSTTCPMALEHIINKDAGERPRHALPERGRDARGLEAAAARHRVGPRVRGEPGRHGSGRAAPDARRSAGWQRAGALATGAVALATASSSFSPSGSAVSISGVARPHRAAVADPVRIRPPETPETVGFHGIDGSRPPHDSGIVSVDSPST
jgi:hypothetical protein